MTDYSHFPEEIYNMARGTHIRALADTLSGEVGSGSVNKRLFFARLNSYLGSMYFTDLDYIFGVIFGFPRVTSEQYDLDPYTTELTKEQRDEIDSKDARYKGRIMKFLQAINAGPTVLGFRLLSEAVFDSDADIYEIFHYLDGELAGSLGRTNTRSEIVVTPHRTTIDMSEYRLYLHLSDRLKPAGLMVTVNTNGLAVDVEIQRGVSADSRYFEVQKYVTGSLNWPHPYRPGDGLWVEQGVEHEVPKIVFSNTQEETFDQLRYVSSVRSSSNHRGRWSTEEELAFPVLKETKSTSEDPIEAISALPELERSNAFSSYVTKERRNVGRTISYPEKSSRQPGLE